MKPRTFSTISGVLLCTILSPLPFIASDEPSRLVLVVDPEYPYFCEQDEAEMDKNSDFLYVKPASWFISREIPLCSVRTVPHEHRSVHKPPWR